MLKLSEMKQNEKNKIWKHTLGEKLESFIIKSERDTKMIMMPENERVKNEDKRKFTKTCYTY